MMAMPKPVAMAAVERPYIESGAAQTSGDSGDDHAERDRKLGAAARDQERSGNGGDGE
jgi:hypothetical protein